jgi:hypothetical protein
MQGAGQQGKLLRFLNAGLAETCLPWQLLIHAVTARAPACSQQSASSSSSDARTCWCVPNTSGPFIAGTFPNTSSSGCHPRHPHTRCCRCVA